MSATIVLVWILNFAISIWNAYACGKIWVEAKHAGGWTRFMTLMGALMSASGFSWCYLIFACFVAKEQAWITEHQFAISLQLGYVLLIPGVLLSSYAITFDSWARAYRERDLFSMGTAAWNTYATIHNTYNAIESFGPALKNVISAFSSSGSSDDDDNSGAGILIILVLVVGSIALGFITTAVIISKVAGNNPLPEYMCKRNQ